MSWLINLSGLTLMALIVWWFWLSSKGRPAKRAAGGAIDIVVQDGVYEPSVIEVDAGETLTLRFDRRDPSPCAEQVIFHKLDVSRTLPVGEKTTVTLTPNTPGTYRFTCQMRMYQGTLIVH